MSFEAISILRLFSSCTQWVDQLETLKINATHNIQPITIKIVSLAGLEIPCVAQLQKSRVCVTIGFQAEEKLSKSVGLTIVISLIKINKDM